MRAVLFDLDGTLLDIDLADFIPRYFGALAAATADRFPGIDLVRAIGASTEVMMLPHAGVTNREAFYADFRERTAIDLAEEWPVFETFYAETFPTLAGCAAPKPGARRAVLAARDLGMRVAVATNPIFPMQAVRHRLAWAGLADIEPDVITTYETMHACKPHPAYFRETAEMLGVAAASCLMVGDDRYLDMAAADVGMRTFYVDDGDDGDDPRADWRGSLEELADLLPRLAASAG